MNTSKTAKSSAVLLFLFFISAVAYSQVTVAPVAIHIGETNKNGYMLIRNNSTNADWEVSIEMKFGYPQSDTAGNTYIYFPETEKADDPSAVKWISFFPRKFILKPLEEQTVRIAAKPPKDLKDGEYWGRPIIYSHALNAVDTTNKEQIEVGLSVQFQTVIALNYRKGKSSTGINLTSFEGKYENDKIILSAGVKREGICAYIGSMNAKIFNDKNEAVKELKQEIAIYYTLERRIEFDVTGLSKGQYYAEIEFNTNREEPGGVIIKGNSITKKIPVTIN
ncbi:MAG: hypothetical protein NTV87_13570 [Ignavibacteriae bacterium]|nr:hypothetical protein [Ignavibacteriota bacterium]